MHCWAPPTSTAPCQVASLRHRAPRCAGPEMMCQLAVGRSFVAEQEVRNSVTETTEDSGGQWFRPPPESHFRDLLQYGPVSCWPFHGSKW